MYLRRPAHVPDLERLQLQVIVPSRFAECNKAVASLEDAARQAEDGARRSEQRRHRLLALKTPPRPQSASSSRGDPIAAASPVADSPPVRVTGADTVDLIKLTAKKRARTAHRLAARRTPSNYPPGVEALANPGPSRVSSLTNAVSPLSMGFDGVPFSPLDPQAFRDDEGLRGLMLQWFRSIPHEEASFSSVAVWAQCTHRQIQRATSSLPSPNLFRVCAASLLLMKVCAEISARYEDTVKSGTLSQFEDPTSKRRTPATRPASPPSSASSWPASNSVDDEYCEEEKGLIMPVLRILLNDVFSAVFEDWESNVRPFERVLKSHDYESVFGDINIYATLTTKVKEELENLQNVYSERNTSLELERQKKTIIMAAEVQSWKNHLLRCILRAWRAQARELARGRNTLTGVILRLTSQVQHFAMWVAFVLLREHCIASKHQKDTAEYEKTKREWRAQKAEQQLTTSTLRADLVQCKREHLEDMDAMAREHRQQLGAMQDKIDAMERNLAEMRDHTRRLEASLEEISQEKNKWVHLCNRMMYQLSGGDIDGRDHPFYALLTDKAKRAQHRQLLTKQLEGLRQLSATYEAHSVQTSGKEWERAGKDQAWRQREIGKIEHELQLLGDPEQYDLVSDFSSLPELLSTNHAIDRILLRFCNFMLDKHGIKRAQPVENFTTDMQDSEVFIVLLHAMWPDVCGLDGLSKANHHSRAVGVVESLHLVGLEGMLGLDDILLGRAHRVVIFLGVIFRRFCTAAAVGMTGESGYTSLGNSSDILDEVEWITDEGKQVNTGEEKENDEASDSTESQYATEGESDGGSEVSLGDKMMHRRSKKKVPLPEVRVVYDIEHMENRYNTLTKANKGWLYLGELISKDILRRLQSGRTKEGDVLDARGRRMMYTFTQLDEDHTADFIHSGKNTGDELSNCEDVLANAYEDLRRIYQYYATQDAGGRLSQHGFWNFCKDSRLLAAVGKKGIEQCYQKSATDLLAPPGTPPPPFMPTTAGISSGNKRGVDQARTEASSYYTDLTVSPRIFVESLARIAALRHTKRDGIPVSRALQRILDELVLPSAGKCAIDDFKRSLKSPDVQRVLKKAAKNLQRGFRSYVTTGRNEEGQHSVNLEEYHRFMKECKLLDAKFTYFDATTLFTNITYNEMKSPETETMMAYNEWVEALAGMVVFKHPAPYLPLSHRIESFFKQVLFPRLRGAFRRD